MRLNINGKMKMFLKIPTLTLSVFTLLAPLAVIPQVHAAALFNEYSIPTFNSNPTAITKGPDGAMWFTETDGEKIGRIDSTGTVTNEYSTLNPYASPGTLTTGPDGVIWYGGDNYGIVGRIGADGSVTEYTAFGGARNIISGSDGQLWFANGDIESMTTSGTVTRFPLGQSIALGLTQDSNGNFWSLDLLANQVIKMTPSGVVSTYAIPDTSVYTSYPPACENASCGLTNGPDGAVWFTAPDRKSIGRVTSDGQVKIFSVPTANPGINRITTGPDGALWFTERNVNQIGRITTDGQVTEYQVPTADSGPSDLAFDSTGALWFTESNVDKIGKLTPVSTPSAPTNLTLTTSSPTNQYPGLSWTASTGATSYNVYRNNGGTPIGSTTSTTYSDTSAPEGTDSYYITAVNGSGESPASNTVGVLVDRTDPTITYSVSPMPNSAGWNNSSVTVSFSCSDNTGGSGIASCSSPQTESTDGQYTLTGYATDNAGNTSSANVTINLDQTAPTVSSVALATDPLPVNQTTTLSANVADNLSGVAKAEYYTGTDPGQGNGTPMTITNGVASATVGNYATAGMYTYYVRTEDNAGNWSMPMSVTLDVYNPTGGYTAAHGFVTPSGPTSNPGDTLPTESGNNLMATLDYTVKYVSSTSTLPTGTSTFTWGSTCNSPKSNCFVVTTDTTVTPAIGSLSWLIVPGDNTATFEGTATLSQGSTTIGTNYPIKVSVVGTTTTTPGHYELQVYPTGSDPNTATPLYQASGDLTGGSVVMH